MPSSRAISETTLYRKYRPQSFAEIIGQDEVKTVLEKAVATKTPAHSYLFAGGRGTGKTSTARIFAHALGVSINDVYEMDAASNRGIDDIKAIRDGVAVSPLESPWKVYIIDEAHMLTKEAWNALLKTLEEPPAHVIFILATTEFEKVPDTIISRCQVFNFKKPSLETLRATVVDIAKREGITLEPAAAELIALLGDGSFRDALGVLQKVLGAKSGKISRADVETLTGSPRGALVRDFVAGLATRNPEQSLQALHRAVADNVDVALFTTLVLDLARAVLLVRVSPATAAHLINHFSDEDKKFINTPELAAGISSRTITALIDAAVALRATPIPQLPLELAVVNLCQSEK